VTDAGDSITIEVALFATLRKYHPAGSDAGPVWMAVPEGATVRELLEILGVPAAQAKQAFINNRQTEDDRVIRDGERVAIFPPIAGG
jgi:molybdopterin converting factor small subunit